MKSKGWRLKPWLIGAGLIGLGFSLTVNGQQPGAPATPPSPPPGIPGTNLTPPAPPAQPPAPAAAPAAPPSSTAPAAEPSSSAAPAPGSPATPGAPPARPVKKSGKPSGEEPFTINFQDVELQEIIKTFSDILHKNFILEEMPKGKITVISPAKIPRSQAQKIFETILNLNGYNIVETAVPNLYRVIRVGDVIRSNIPIYSGGAQPTVADTYVTRFIPLEYLNAKDIAGTIQPLLSKEGASAIGYDATNTLILVDTSLNIERILRIVKILDVPGKEPQLEIIRCKYALATDLANTLNQIFGEVQPGAARAGTAPAAAGRAARAAKPGRNVPASPAAGQPQPESQSQGAGPPIKIIPELRINALIVIADSDSLQEVKRVIKLIDIDAGDTSTIHVYYLENADARELAGTLGSLTGGGSGYTPSTTSTGYGTGYSSSGSTMNTQNLVGMGTSMSTQARAPAAAPMGTTSATLQGLFGGPIRITADQVTNSLIIVSSPQDYELIKIVIAKLDIPRNQVFVEAVLLEITVTKDISAGVSWHGASPMGDGGAVMGGTSLSSLNSMALLSLLQSGNIALPSGLTIGAIGKPISIGGTTVQIPSAGVLVQLLASNSDVNVLSTPMILTTNNKEASLAVGQRIPVPTGQTISTGGLSSTSISREEIGVKLKMTPQINEGRTIKMDIYTEISGVVGNSLGINVNTNGVVTSLKTATTSVIVKDGQTIVIGGLMQDSVNTSNTRVPFLGDIPVLGYLFKSKGRNKMKTNLVILLTPHIVVSEADIARVREQVQKDYDHFIEETMGKKYPKHDEYFEPRLDVQHTPRVSNSEVIDLTKPVPTVIEPTPQAGPAAAPPAEALTPAPAPPAAPAVPSSGPAAPAPTPEKNELFNLWLPETPETTPGATVKTELPKPAAPATQPGATVKAGPPNPAAPAPQPGATVKAEPPQPAPAPAPTQPAPAPAPEKTDLFNLWAPETPATKPGATVNTEPPKPAPPAPTPQPGATAGTAPPASENPPPSP